MNTGRRQRLSVELRSEVAGDRLSGHAAVFGQFADLGSHLEELARTAFDRVLAGDPDVRALINHDPSLLFARTRNGSLKLSTDDSGLYFEVPRLPNTSYARDLRELVGQGLLTQMSFGFIPGEQDKALRDGRRIVRHTSVAELLDISPVTYPAYEATDVALRSWPPGTGAGAQRPLEQMIRLRAANREGRK